MRVVRSPSIPGAAVVASVVHRTAVQNPCRWHAAAGARRSPHTNLPPPSDGPAGGRRERGDDRGHAPDTRSDRRRRRRCARGGARTAGTGGRPSPGRADRAGDAVLVPAARGCGAVRAWRGQALRPRDARLGRRSLAHARRDRLGRREPAPRLHDEHRPDRLRPAAPRLRHAPALRGRRRGHLPRAGRHACDRAAPGRDRGRRHAARRVRRAGRRRLEPPGVRARPADREPSRRATDLRGDDRARDARAGAARALRLGRERRGRRAPARGGSGLPPAAPIPPRRAPASCCWSAATSCRPTASSPCPGSPGRGSAACRRRSTGSCPSTSTGASPACRTSTRRAT